MDALGDERANSELLARVNSEYAAALGKMEESFTPFKGTAKRTTTILSKDKNKRILYQEYKFNVDHDSGKFEVHLDEQRASATSSMEAVYSTNSHYAFRLRRDRSEDRWSLVGVDRAKRVQYDDTFMHRMGQFLFASFCIDEYVGRRVLGSDGFAFTKVTSFERQGHQLLKLDFKLKSNPTLFFDSGWVVVSPDDGWATMESECYRPGRKNRPFRRVVEYSRPIERMLIPRRVTVTDPGESVVSVIEFEELQPEATSEREFTLLHYGLPEIDQTGRRRHVESVIYWLTGLAVGALLISLVLRRVGTRIQTAHR